MDEFDSIISIGTNTIEHLYDLLATLRTFRSEKTTLHGFLGIGSYRLRLLIDNEKHRVFDHTAISPFNISCCFGAEPFTIDMMNKYYQLVEE